MSVGWSRSGWNEGPWGQPASVPISFTITGVSATASIGSVTEVEQANIITICIAATESLGTPTL